MAYIATADFLDPEIKKIITNTQAYITNAELWFVNFVSNIGGTLPVEGAETENQNRLMIVRASEMACQDRMGLTHNEVQEGVLDKYAIKFQALYNERTGEKIGQFSETEMNLMNIVRDELVGGTGTGGVTLDFNM